MGRRLINTVSIVHEDLPLDVVLYNIEDGNLYRTNRLWDKSADIYQPVGVVVCPEACYDDGTVGVMALSFLLPPKNSGMGILVGGDWTMGMVNPISCQFNVGQYNAVMNNISRVGTRILNEDDVLIEDYRDVASDGYTSTQTPYIGIDLPIDDGSYNDSVWRGWPNSLFKSEPILLDDETLNPKQTLSMTPPYDTIPTQNALVDFGGKNKFDMIINQWPTSFAAATDDPNIFNSSNYCLVSGTTELNGKLWTPAIIACRFYHTPGTVAGDWYLPAIGECACLHNKTNRLFKTHKMIKAWTDYPIISTLESIILLSSTGAVFRNSYAMGGLQKHYYIYGIEHANVASMGAVIFGGLDGICPNAPQKMCVVPYMRGIFERI